MNKFYSFFFLFFLLAASNTAFALTCNDLDGAYIVAQDGTYLGFFGGQFSAESIYNSFGNHGSEFSSTSVRNQFSNYGSEFATFSATNRFTNTPPVIFRYGEAIGLLTANTFLTDGISLETIDGACIFTSATAKTESFQLPAPLSGLVASDGAFTDRVLLTWNLTSGAGFYEVYFSTTLNGERTFIDLTTGSSMTITGTEPGTTYYFFVFPVNSAGTGTGQWDTGFSLSTIGNWPSPYNGVTAPPGLGLQINNIGVFNPQDQLIYTCVEIQSNGSPVSSDGISEFGIGIRIISLENGFVEIVKSRPFNSEGARNEFGELPNCSGVFESSTNQYSDIIRSGDQFFVTTFELVDLENLVFQLIAISEL